ncbi:sarcosine oxidase [Ureibacillus massiliensis 4400831 = CIP 108448 = CCUG 49529]|uniref:Sarcosine oxidase n=1 Tax=Ureibacillus massiliensis 4400831 = CIP 108448 = CCUG 49529 TaxID=1211035 RepID=A0A0A3IYR8_9BACL|nr:N-methyl-L-tryptophan oxidase [Ureibacillus massiliensis]KGR89909.1 sarcosine oxidase [Ureibacillus massiliensis 4400831 = CIP 108448 = CCUG 49529]
MEQKKVAVIGIGSIGSMVLWQLAKKGIQAVGFEQYGIAHDRSAAGGESRMFRTAYMEGAEYVPMLKKSRLLWEELEEETGYNLLTLNGGLMIGPKDIDEIKNVIRSIKEFEIDHEILNVEEAKKHFPQHVLREDEIMVLDKEAGYMRPELAVFAAAERAESLGAIIHRHTTVEQIEELNDKVRIVANGENYEFDQVIVTAGPWTTRIFPELKENLTPKKLVMTWYPTSKIENYQPDKFPVFARMTEGITFFGIPSLEGTMVKVASVDTFGNVEVPDKLIRDIKLSELKNIKEAVSTYLPELRPDPVRISVHMDGYTTDGHAVVGLVPGLKNTFIMGGYSGHGFKLAPVMGKIGLDLVEQGDTEFDISHLRPGRFFS